MQHTHEPSPLHVLTLSAFLLAAPLYTAAVQSERSMDTMASTLNVTLVQSPAENNGCFFDADCYPFETCTYTDDAKNGQCELR